MTAADRLYGITMQGERRLHPGFRKSDRKSVRQIAGGRGNGRRKSRVFPAGWSGGLSKTRDSIVSGIDSIFSGFSSIDDDFYEEIEEILVMGDIGINATSRIISNLKMEVAEKHIKEPSQCKQLLIGQHQAANGGGRHRLRI